MTTEPSTNHVQIESLETLPSDAASDGSLALVQGDPTSIGSSRLSLLEQDFGSIYFVKSVDAIDFSGVDGITNVSKFAAIGFGLVTEHALSIADYLTGLTVLYLDDNRIAAAGLRALAKISNLTSLHVANNGVGRGVTALDELWQLTDLDISRNSLGGKKVLTLGELGNLERLTVDACHVYAKNLHVLTRLPKLRSLSIVGNNIGDEGAKILSEISSLTELNVADNGLTGDGIEALRALPNLTNLVTDQ